ncbi:hypothetical protein BH20VER3_BH20VER3_13800 [soil metagenome]
MKFAAFQVPLLLLGIAFAAVQPAAAQTVEVDRARLFRSQSSVQPPVSVSPEGVDQGYAAASPNDSDLGEQAILKRAEQYDPFTLEVGLPIYYTSNATLVGRGREGDVIALRVENSDQLLELLSGENATTANGKVTVRVRPTPRQNGGSGRTAPRLPANRPVNRTDQPTGGNESKQQSTRVGPTSIERFRD